jgi:hypothetical protein
LLGLTKSGGRDVSRGRASRCCAKKPFETFDFRLIRSEQEQVSPAAIDLLLVMIDLVSVHVSGPW